jgi:malonate-semialdehyde dehydrogenase (acetylating)/methylmalonate-semialdehyde dehydrogenase
VINLVHGGKDAVDALLDHPEVRAISFVGSTPVARYIYSRAAANGKRVQCQGGAKNPIVVLPDADMEMTTKIVADSAFGCAGQRCLASSVVIAVADAAKPFTQQISDAATSRKVGYGLDKGTEMVGDLVREPHPHRSLIAQASPREPSRWSMVASRRFRAMTTATSSGRRCSPTSILRASWRAPKCSVPC